METVWSIVVQVVWWLFSWVWWLLVNVFWLLLWTVLPLAVAAFIAVRAAERILGKAVVQAWVKKQSLRLGQGTWRRVRRGLFALGALPLRVLGWLIVYTLWHAVVSLWWKPRWNPWKLAWGRRWKQPMLAKQLK